MLSDQRDDTDRDTDRDPSRVERSPWLLSGLFVDACLSPITSAPPTGQRRHLHRDCRYALG